MVARKTISKKIRFEVFKRDKFTCQYCGRKAPEVILHIDHIEPVSKGGSNDIINLITSCKDCNLGKRDRKLDDTSVLLKQRKQLEELQEKREQMEMMLQWRKSLDDFESEKLNLLCDYWNSKIIGYSINEHGKKEFSSYLQKFDFNDILDAIDIAVKKYLKFDLKSEEHTKESVDLAFQKIGGILNLKKLPPIRQKIAYIKGICRNRFNYWDEKKGSIILQNYVNTLQEKNWTESQILNDLDKEVIKISKESKNWTEWRNILEKWIDDINNWEDDKDEEDDDENIFIFVKDESDDEYQYLIDHHLKKIISKRRDLILAIKIIGKEFENFNENVITKKIDRILFNLLTDIKEQAVDGIRTSGQDILDNIIPLLEVEKIYYDFKPIDCEMRYYLQRAAEELLNFAFHDIYASLLDYDITYSVFEKIEQKLFEELIK